MENRHRRIFEGHAPSDGALASTGAPAHDAESDEAAIRFGRHVLDRFGQAMAEGWIRPHYQAIVRSATGNVCGEEALARWNDPELGWLQPLQFVPVLEEAGLSHELDMYMVDCVVADLVEKLRLGVPAVPVSVNVALRDLGAIDIVDELSRRMDAAGVPHGLLRVEFTETAVLDDSKFFVSQVNALRAAGFEVWMDDFGSGYSSVTTLQEFPFDAIKMDMACIANVDSGKVREVVAGMVRIAKKLGIGTLAEGVETMEQALFLEAIGCDMLQGFLYTRPLPLEEVNGRFFDGIGIRREDPAESEYWKAVGAVDLVDPLNNVDGRAVDGSRLSEFPASVMERRDGEWIVARANRAFREFLDKGGVLPLARSSLQAHPIERDVDEEFLAAAERSLKSGMWERVAGRLEYGTGLQFYTRLVASSARAQSFILAAVPNMLGTALGSYGDVPVAYAVFRVRPNEGGDGLVDAEYLFANSVYYELGGHEAETLSGAMLTQKVGEESRIWLPFLYRAAVLGETVHDVVYTHELNHWLSFNVAPSPIERCCIFAFTIADAEQNEREEILIERNTSDIIVRIMDAFNSERDFDVAMDSLLATMSRIIHPKRLFIFERAMQTDWVTHEWCANAADRQIDLKLSVNNTVFSAWDKLAEGDSVIYVNDVSVVKAVDEGLYRKLVDEGVTRVLAAPLVDGDTVIGNLVAENYRFEEGFDIRRLIESAASFISSRIVNQRLVTELERAGMHDALTGLLNRRGFDSEMTRSMARFEGAPYVLALMDIDDFKTVNDLYGHDVGDAALWAIARAVENVVPDDAVIGRNGGDEFVIALFGSSAARADEVFAQLAGCELGCEHGGKWYNLSVSIGFAGCPDQASSLKEAYSKADAALYAVKLAGKAGSKRYAAEVESQYRSQLGFTPRDIAENVPGAILVHRAGGNGEILFANDELVEMFECDGLADFMDYTGGTFAGIVHPDDGPRVYGELVHQVGLDEVGAKNFSNYRIVTKKGNVKRVADNGRLVEVDEVGKVFYVLLIDRDERDAAE